MKSLINVINENMRDYIPSRKSNETQQIVESVFRNGGHTKDSILSTEEMYDRLSEMNSADYKQWEQAILKDSAVKKACKSCDNKTTKLVVNEFISSWKNTGMEYDSAEETQEENGDYWFENIIYLTLEYATDELGYEYDDEMSEWGDDVEIDDLVLAIEQVFINNFL